MNMNKLFLRAVFVLFALIAVSSCAAFSIRSTLNSLKPGLSREEVMSKKDVQSYLHTTEFEQDRQGNDIERLIFRIEVFDSGKIIGHDWVTLWFRNGRLFEKNTEFVPAPPPPPALPMPVQRSNAK